MSALSEPVHAPTDIASLAELLARANRERTPIEPSGGRTKWRWEPPTARPAVIVSTTQLSPGVDHCAGDLTATIGAGMTLAAANSVLARAGQWLALDPTAADRATIGGIVAANDSGPRRHKYGAPRDLIIGIEFVRADGTVAKAGGKVVKNVAGYDLARMLCGSLGSLAVITNATFKLLPLAAVSRTVVASARHARACVDLAKAIGAAPTSPAAVEIESPPYRVLARFETTEHAADAQAAATVNLCRSLGADAVTLAGSEEQHLWAMYDAAVWSERIDSILVKVSVLPSEVGALLEQAGAAAASGRGALGVLYLRWEGPSHAGTRWLQGLRERVSGRGGSAVVVKAPAAWSGQIDPWGLPAVSPVAAAVKARFDPNNILNPGRGPGGI